MLHNLPKQCHYLETLTAQTSKDISDLNSQTLTLAPSQLMQNAHFQYSLSMQS